VKIIRFEHEGEIRYGIWEGETVYAARRSDAGDYLKGKAITPASQVRLLAPCEPTKIIAVGLNYRAHAEEAGMTIPSEPLIFLKPPSAVIGPGDPIVWPPASQRVDYECELCVVIGRRASRLTAAEARDYILGYTCGNDVTARDLQAKDPQWTRAKGFDTFCPLGPHIETDLEPNNVIVRTRMDGVIRQESSTSDMIWPVEELMVYISHIMTLEPGDVIMTGTPAGIGPVRIGGIVEVEVEGIGTLHNPVTAR